MPSFFDTNVLVYLVDADEPAKQEVSRGLVQEHLADGDGAISVQVLREFFFASRKLRTPVSYETAREAVEYFAKFSPLQEDADMVLKAVRRTGEMSLSFWDALIVEAALKSGADRLLTEDMQHGQIIEGMLVENPFL
ncbi:PIN domain-containing protein [Rubrobacter tropicus]|uniref:Ribonuclease VapC n=1 Tax=Rubrobacter tropicus TaxID=2653851 RepID=A0A6G8QCF6_9ACTN|nr:PIN domain-containing protein [Rubrobacter tropicus]QIN84194.1 PIN domain-containing protein [Rubrobacter tropicus]